MSYFPPPQAAARPPRVRFEGATPAVLRSKDGSRASGKLEIVSLTGGLLSLSKPLDQGSNVRLLFVTQKGSVFGRAEMLSPISWALQPFRFIALPDKDERKLKAAIQNSMDLQRANLVRLERHRAW